MAKVEWEDYWSTYRNIPVKQKEDLFYQVGKTIGGKPITEDTFALIVNTIVHNLELNKKDLVLDLCCGNGLITLELSKQVDRVIGIDFSQHLIESARAHQGADNIMYLFGDIVKVLDNQLTTIKADVIKITMNEALAYFDNDTAFALLKRLKQLCEDTDVKLDMFITGIPSDELKWNFYNTPERKEKYLQNESEGSNGGIGKWWKKEEIETICNKLDLSCEFKNQDPRLSNYRIDAHIRCKK